MRRLDIYSPLPPDVLEKYDIVNVRLFICAVRDNEPLPVLKNLLKMLSESPLLVQRFQTGSKSRLLACIRLTGHNRAGRISPMV